MDNKRETKKQREIKYLIINYYFNGSYADGYVNTRRYGKMTEYMKKRIDVNDDILINEIKNSNEYINLTFKKYYELFYNVDVFKKPMRDELNKILGYRHNYNICMIDDGDIIKMANDFRPLKIYRINDMVYRKINEVEGDIIEEIKEETDTYIDAHKKIDDYCKPIIKKEYNKLLDRYFYKDMQNIITNYLL